VAESLALLLDNSQALFDDVARNCKDKLGIQPTTEIFERQDPPEFLHQHPMSARHNVIRPKPMLADDGYKPDQVDQRGIRLCLPCMRLRGGR
jgi:hypothetical protein